MSLRKSPVVLIALVFMACFWAAIPASANLLLDGSFEKPVVDPTSHCGAYAYCHGYHTNPTYPPDDSIIGNWVVIGTSDIDCTSGQCVPNGHPAPVMLMTDQYQEKVGNTNDPLYFHVHDGNQAIDLTGEGNQSTDGNTWFQNGVKQTVDLAPGQYQLSFWLGHQDSSAPGYENGPSIISLWINGIEQSLFSNDQNTFHDVSWEQFFFNFNASGDTTIAFISETPLGNNYAGLDDVNLVQTPEPASILLLASGLGGILIRRRLRK